MSGGLLTCKRCRRKFHAETGLFEPSLYPQKFDDGNIGFCRGCKRTMMGLSPRFSDSSLEILASVHVDLQLLVYTVIEDGFDCQPRCGHRGKEAQDAAYESGASQLKYPDSKHNKLPSLALDICPYPFHWPDIEKMDKRRYARECGRFYFFGGYLRRRADELGIKIRQGMNWKRNFDVRDQSFDDLPHVEIFL